MQMVNKKVMGKIYSLRPVKKQNRLDVNFSLFNRLLTYYFTSMSPMWDWLSAGGKNQI